MAKKSRRSREDPDPGRRGDARAAGRYGARPARHQHHGLLQGVQRGDREPAGQVIPAEISIYEDRTFTFITKTPPTPFLLRQAAGIEKGSSLTPPGEGGHGHQGPGARDRRAEDARPQRHRHRRRDGPGRGHRPLDGHRRRRLDPIDSTTRRRRTSPPDPGTDTRELPKGAHMPHGKKYIDAGRRSTGSSCTTRSRRSSS